MVLLNPTWTSDRCLVLNQLWTILVGRALPVSSMAWSPLAMRVSCCVVAVVVLLAPNKDRGIHTNSPAQLTNGSASDMSDKAKLAVAILMTSVAKNPLATHKSYQSCEGWTVSSSAGCNATFNLCNTRQRQSQAPPCCQRRWPQNILSIPWDPRHLWVDLKFCFL